MGERKSSAIRTLGSAVRKVDAAPRGNMKPAHNFDWRIGFQSPPSLPRQPRQPRRLGVHHQAQSGIASSHMCSACADGRCEHGVAGPKAGVERERAARPRAGMCVLRPCLSRNWSPASRQRPIEPHDG